MKESFKGTLLELFFVSNNQKIILMYYFILNDINILNYKIISV